MDYYAKVLEATACIQEQVQLKPTIGLILGSGLGDLAEEFSEAIRIPYEEIPHFPLSTVEGHAGQLVIGQLSGKTVIALQGRFHYYEGYSMKAVVFPVYVLKQLGAQLLLVTNACGGMNRQFAPGDLMLITDHLNCTGDNPLIGFNHAQLGPRFPDMSRAYTPELISMVEDIASDLGIQLHKGVYAGISGPNYLAAAELRMLARVGGDVVGMSTVPEVIAAAHTGLQVIGLSCVTDMAIAGEVESISHEEVMAVAQQTKPIFMRLVKEIVGQVRVS